MSGELDVAAVEAITGVDLAVERTYFVTVVVSTEDGPVDVEDYLSPVTQRGNHSHSSTVIRGRWLDVDDPSEAVAHFTVADEFGIDVGDTVTLPLLTEEENNAVEAGDYEIIFGPHGHEVTVEIVGIDAQPAEFPPREDGSGAGPLTLSPALFDQLPDDLAVFEVVAIRLERGADLDAVTGSLDAAGLAWGTADAEHAATNRAIGVQVVALAILAALSGVALRWFGAGGPRLLSPAPH